MVYSRKNMGLGKYINWSNIKNWDVGKLENFYADFWGFAIL